MSHEHWGSGIKEDMMLAMRGYALDYYYEEGGHNL